MKSIPTRTKNSVMPLVYSSLERLVFYQHQAQTNHSTWMWVSRIKLGEFDVRHQISEGLYEFVRSFSDSTPTHRMEAHKKLSKTFSYVMLMVMARYDGSNEIATERLFDAFELSVTHKVHADEMNRCVRRIIGQLDTDLGGACIDFFRLMRMAELHLTRVEDIYFGMSEKGLGEAVAL